MILGVQEVANRYEGGQHVHGVRGDDAEASCTYCGRALDYSAGESGGSRVRVPIPCAHGSFSAHKLHAGPGGSQRERTYRSEILRSVPVGVSGGTPTSPPGGTD